LLPWPEGPFARAEQRLEISVPAVQKLVGTLERSLGLTLPERRPRGVRVTPSGVEYLDRCRTLRAEAEELGRVERRMKGTGERPGSTLAVAAHPRLAHHVLLPALPRFHALYPDIEIDFRAVNRIGDADALSADVLLLHGRPEVAPD
jgi:DNA-binding transcriptional LysR family regulator